MAIGKNVKSDKLISEDADAPKGKSVKSKSSSKAVAESKMDQEMVMAALDQAVDSIVMIDDSKSITFFNKSAEAMFGYKPAEVMGKNVKMIVPGHLQKDHDSFVDNNIKTGKNKVVGKGRELEMVRKDGSTFQGHLSLSKVQSNGTTVFTAFIKDVTKEFQLREDSKLAMDRLNGTLEQALDAVVMIDSSKLVSFFNKKAEELFGYNREEVIGNNVKMIVPPEHQGPHDDYVDNNIKTGVNKVVGLARELEMNRKDGSKFWGQLSLSKVELSGETYYTAFIKDITQQRKLQEEAKIGMLRLNETLEQALDGIITIDSTKTVTFFNKKAEEIFGYNRNEVLGENVKMIVPSEHQPPHDSYVDNNIRTGVNKVVGLGRELVMVRKDGSKFWGHLSLSKVSIEGETYYTAFIKDITEEKERKLNLEGILSAIDQAMAKIEFEPDGTIITANDAFLQTMGYGNLSEIKGKHHRIFGKPEFVNSPDYTKLWKDLANGIMMSGELERVKKDGSVVWLNGSYSPVVDEDGNVLKVIKLATNITDVKVPILKVSEIIRQMSEGDITSKYDMNAEGYVQEMGQALNSALDNLNTLLSNIQESSVVVGDSAKASLDLTENMKKNTREVAAAISQIAKGAQDQAMRTDESSKLVNDVLESSMEMQKKSDVINQTAESGKQSSANGLTIMKALVENMADISESAGMTSQSIAVLTTRAEEIGRTLNVITDIAAQTNLLALNAAIEAARAGDAGRGFAVVAEEIRKLAEDSRKSAIDIEKIIGDVQKDTQSAGKAIENMTKSVKDGNAATKDAETIFQEIAASNDETFNISLEIKNMSTDQKSSVDAVAKNIEQIVVVAEETAAGAQQVASSSQELNSSMEEIGNAGSRLAEIAAELEAGINQFTLR